MEMLLRQVKLGEREILSNLLEKYEYEFSQYSKTEMNDLGLFGYPYLDYYWTEPNRFAYFIMIEAKIAGFIMINGLPELEQYPADYQVAEFFVLPQYRKKGIGKAAIFKVWSMHPGQWQLKYHPDNIASKHFWNSCVDEYTDHQYLLVEDAQEVSYVDGTGGSVLIFKTI